MGVGETLLRSMVFAMVFAGWELFGVTITKYLFGSAPTAYDYLGIGVLLFFISFAVSKVIVTLLRDSGEE